MATIGRTLRELDPVELPIKEDHILAISDPSGTEIEDIAYKVRIGDLIVGPVDPDKIKTKSIREDDGDVYYGSSFGNITINNFRVGTFSDARDYDEIEVGDVVFVGPAAPYADGNIGTVVEKREDLAVLLDSIDPAAGADFVVAKTRLYIGKLDESIFQDPEGLSNISVGARTTFVGGNVRVDEEVRAYNIVATNGIEALITVETPTVITPQIESSADITMKLLAGGTANRLTISTEAITQFSSGVHIKAYRDQFNGGEIYASGRAIRLNAATELRLQAKTLLYDITGDATFTSLVKMNSGAEVSGATLLKGGATISGSTLEVTSQNIELTKSDTVGDLRLDGGADIKFINEGDISWIGRGSVVLDRTSEGSYMYSPLFTGGSFIATDNLPAEPLKLGVVETKDGHISTTGSGGIKTTGTGSISSAANITAVGTIQGAILKATSVLEVASVKTDAIKPLTYVTPPEYDYSTYIDFEPDEGMPGYPSRPTYMAETGEDPPLLQSFADNATTRVFLDNHNYIIVKKLRRIDTDYTQKTLWCEVPGIYEYDVSIRFASQIWNGAKFSLFVQAGYDNAFRADARSYYHPINKTSGPAMLTAHGFCELSINSPFWLDVYQRSGAARDVVYVRIYLRYDCQAF